MLFVLWLLFCCCCPFEFNAEAVVSFLSTVVEDVDKLLLFSSRFVLDDIFSGVCFDVFGVDGTVVIIVFDVTVLLVVLGKFTLVELIVVLLVLESELGVLELRVVAIVVVVVEVVLVEVVVEIVVVVVVEIVVVVVVVAVVVAVGMTPPDWDP